MQPTLDNVWNVSVWLDKESFRMPKRSVRRKSLSFSKTKRNTSSLFWFLILFILLPLLVWVVFKKTRYDSKAVTDTPIFGNAAQFVSIQSPPYSLCLKTSSTNNFLFTYPTDIQQYTIEGWVKPYRVENATGGVEEYLISTENIGYLLPIKISLIGNKPTFVSMVFVPNQGLFKSSFQSTQPLTQNTWYHFALVSDMKITRTAKFFIDGKELASIPYIANISGTTTNSSLVLGCQHKEGQAQQYSFHGELDDILISKSARYTTSFTPIKLPYQVNADALALWHMDSPSGSSTTPDASTAHNDLKVIGVNYFYFVPSTIVPLPSTPNPTPSLTPTPTLSPSSTPTPTPGLLPDVRVNGISKDLTKRELRVDVCNDGPVGISQPFNVKMVWQDKTHSFSTQSYAPKSCAPVTLSCQGWHNVCLWPSITATADSDNAVEESNEKNNSLTVKFSNQAPEVVIGELKKGKKGQQYDENIGGFDWDLGDVLSLTTTPLPQGLSLANCKQSEELYEGKPSYNCAITGKPKKSGKSLFTVTIKDNRGGIGQGKGTIVIK